MKGLLISLVYGLGLAGVADTAECVDIEQDLAVWGPALHLQVEKNVTNAAPFSTSNDNSRSRNKRKGKERKGKERKEKKRKEDLNVTRTQFIQEECEGRDHASTCKWGCSTELLSR